MPGILSPRIQLLHNHIQNFGAGALREFWDEIEQQGTPLIETATDGYSLVTFLWRDDGSARNVAVIQDWGTDGMREHHMTLLPGSDLWYLTRRMRSDTRTTYQLSPSSSLDRSELAPYQVDPLNPNTFTAFLAENGNDILFSLLELPHAPALPWRETAMPRTGTVQLHTPFEDQRRLWVYVPSTAATAPLPVLVVFDGRLYKDQFRLPRVLDYLIGMEQIPPVLALMIDNLDRRELQCQPEFAAYVTEQLMPWLRSVYPVTTEPRQNIVLGSSLGGLAAVFIAYSYPNVFGTVFSQTGWFRWRPEGDPEHHWLARQLASVPKLPLHFTLQVGNLEVALMLDGGSSQLEANQHMRDTLQSRAYSVSYQEYSGGHDASSLEYPLAQGLVGLHG
jgi:enterochelin esterase-like enzyme